MEAWQQHIAFLQRACKFMNEQKFTALKYSNSLGTKLTVGLPEGHIWAGGAEIAGDKQLEGKLKSSQLDLVKALPKVNEKMIVNLVSSTINMDMDKNMFYTVYNKRNGKIGSNSYNRVAVARFPLLEQLNDVEKSTYWSAVKGLRKADIQAYQSLFQYIIPNWNIDNQYSGFSDSMEAPGAFS